jgi:DNA-binding MarR family transcriptional regulator
MNNDIKLLLETAQTLNEKAISLTRCMLLILIAYSEDGIQYRELKAALNLSDGKLISNLRQLMAMGYIRKDEIQLDNKQMAAYTLTLEGKNELIRIQTFIETYLKLVQPIC